MNELIVNLRNLVAMKGWNVAELARQLNISPVSAKGLLTKDDVKPRDATLQAIEDLLAGKTKANTGTAKAKATKTAKPKAAKVAEAAPESEPAPKAKVKQTRKPKVKEPEVDVERMVMVNLLRETGLMDEVVRRVSMVKGDAQ